MTEINDLDEIDARAEAELYFESNQNPRPNIDKGNKALDMLEEELVKEEKALSSIPVTGTH